MKPFRLTSKFYFIFCVVFTAPASWVSSGLIFWIEKLPHENYLYKIYSFGLFEAPTTLLILLLFFWLFNVYLWKLPLIKKLVGIPNVNGRYEGFLTSSYDKEKTKYPTVIEIKQSLTSIKVNLYTQRSGSYNLIANICRNNNENHELVYVYQNRTSAPAPDDDMRDHTGTALLAILNRGSELNGNYFNNPRERGRHGNINVKRTTSKIEGKF
ncbi:MAG: hypothetical protein WC536_00650 [Patescibacteria group bacterium]|jgi:hypothetical protein